MKWLTQLLLSLAILSAIPFSVSAYTWEITGDHSGVLTTSLIELETLCGSGNVPNGTTQSQVYLQPFLNSETFANADGLIPYVYEFYNVNPAKTNDSNLVFSTTYGFGIRCLDNQFPVILPSNTFDFFACDEYPLNCLRSTPIFNTIFTVNNQLQGVNSSITASIFESINWLSLYDLNDPGTSLDYINVDTVPMSGIQPNRSYTVLKTFDFVTCQSLSLSDCIASGVVMAQFNFDTDAFGNIIIINPSINPSMASFSVIDNVKAGDMIAGVANGVADTGTNLWTIVAALIALSICFYALNKVIDMFPSPDDVATTKIYRDAVNDDKRFKRSQRVKNKNL